MKPRLTDSISRKLPHLLAAILLAYANALLWGVFQFDDYNVIVANPRVHTWAAWWADLGVGIRPLLKLSYTLDWTSGLGVTAFHLSNVAIHGVNALLVLLLAQRFAAAQPRLRQDAAPIALTAALLFGLHPIASEAVTYVCGRSASLMTMFYLLGLLSYAAARSSPPSPHGERAGERGKVSAGAKLSAPPAAAPLSLTLSPGGRGDVRDCSPEGRGHVRGSSAAAGSTRRNLQLHLLTPLCFLLALAVKETAVTFAFALLLWELASGGRLRDALRRQWSSWLLLAVAGLYFLGHPGYAAHLERSAELNGAAGNLASTAYAVAWLLRQWLAPFWLNIDPDLPLPHTLDATALLPLLLLAVLLSVAITARRQRPWLTFACAWLLLQLVPLHLVLPRLDVANERQMYLAGWPLALLVATELRLRLAARPRVWRAAVAALALLAGSLTVARNRDYASEIALWEATARVSPDKARVHNNLGYAYAQAGRRDDAWREYRRALQLDPLDVKARHNLKRLEDATATPALP